MTGLRAINSKPGIPVIKARRQLLAFCSDETDFGQLVITMLPAPLHG